MKTVFRWTPLMSCLLFPTSAVYSQYYFYNSRFYESNLSWKLGMSGGMMNCLTDLGGKKAYGRKGLTDVNWKLSKPALSAYATVLYDRWAGLTLEGTYGRVAGTDAWPELREVAAGRFMRNLSFESTIAELLLTGELHPLEWFFPGRFSENCFSPYFILGGGYFSFNPMAKTGSTLIRLQPLHTEGQGFPEYPDRKPYALQQVNLALGFGATWEVSALLHLATEFVYRKLFTDYLDDVSKTYVEPGYFKQYLPANMGIVAIRMADRRAEWSPSWQTVPGEQRGNPENKDAYFSIQVKAGVILGRERKRF